MKMLGLLIGFSAILNFADTAFGAVAATCPANAAPNMVVNCVVGAAATPFAVNFSNTAATREQFLASLDGYNLFVGYIPMTLAAHPNACKGLITIGITTPEMNLSDTRTLPGGTLPGGAVSQTGDKVSYYIFAQGSGEYTTLYFKGISGQVQNIACSVEPVGLF